MSLLLKNVLVLDLNSPAHNKQIDLLIENGIITSLKGKSAKKEIDLRGKTVSCGWFDLNAHFNDPGTEYREDIRSGSAVAAAGGFTDVCLIPETTPPIESKSDVKYILNRENDLVDLHVNAAVSEGLAGENLTEMLDLHQAGAVCFSDGDRPIWNAELLLKALQYTNDLGVPIIQNPRDLHISANTHMHEGKVSTNLGLRGEPSLTEELAIQRDIEILKYSGGKLHFSSISTAKGVELVKKAKKEGLAVTCDVGIHHLIFTDSSIGDFNTNYKSLPPYRTEKDRKSLVKGIKDGTIDAISSNHRPYDLESKQLEFDLAEAGNISLQTFYSCLLMVSKEVPIDILIDRVVNGPRRVLGIDLIKIDEGEKCKLTMVDPEESWILNGSTNQSKSHNSPFWESELKGKVIGTINQKKINI
ncbi:dihydroorotase [Ekhidna lutea]|uniref:Dihydroorotase n=1 Tax=Ekhidna lutea TaxID=447679 RepID=A0A239K7W7_EKHLU|nr:dihydroorotase [Ekhidna lutea]SNT13772.1 dihydroorotase [Ekhidna lutea]